MWKKKTKEKKRKENLHSLHLQLLQLVLGALQSEAGFILHPLGVETPLVKRLDLPELRLCSAVFVHLVNKTPEAAMNEKPHYSRSRRASQDIIPLLVHSHLPSLTPPPLLSSPAGTCQSGTLCLRTPTETPRRQRRQEKTRRSGNAKSKGLLEEN